MKGTLLNMRFFKALLVTICVYQCLYTADRRIFTNQELRNMTAADIEAIKSLENPGPSELFNDEWDRILMRAIGSQDFSYTEKWNDLLELKFRGTWHSYCTGRTVRHCANMQIVKVSGHNCW